MKKEWRRGSPCLEIKRIYFTQDEWVLEQQDGEIENYLQGTILISNFIFTLVQLSNMRQKKLMVLFHDQLTLNQWRLLHLRAQNNHNGV